MMYKFIVFNFDESYYSAAKNRFFLILTVVVHLVNDLRTNFVNIGKTILNN